MEAAASPAAPSDEAAALRSELAAAAAAHEAELAAARRKAEVELQKTAAFWVQRVQAERLTQQMLASSADAALEVVESTEVAAEDAVEEALFYAAYHHEVELQKTAAFWVAKRADDKAAAERGSERRALAVASLAAKAEAAQAENAKLREELAALQKS